MTNNEEAILKRIIKAYLHQNHKATAQQIALYLQTVGFGLRKQYTKESIAKLIKQWREGEATWLRIRWEKNNQGILTFYLIGKGKVKQ